MNHLVLTLLIAFSCFPEASACDFTVVKTMVPLEQKTEFSDLCLDSYFEKRNLAFQSMSDETATFVPDSQSLVFDDIILFETAKTQLMDENGRLKLIEQIFNQYMANLKTDYGVCELQLYSGSQKLFLTDFLILSRTEAGQPGTRRQLTKDHVVSPSWELLCQNSDGFKLVAKKGSYFSIFVDVYENKTFTKTKAHLAKFMFSLRP